MLMRLIVRDTNFLVEICSILNYIPCITIHNMKLVTYELQNQSNRFLLRLCSSYSLLQNKVLF